MQDSIFIWIHLLSHRPPHETEEPNGFTTPQSCPHHTNTTGLDLPLYIYMYICISTYPISLQSSPSLHPNSQPSHLFAVCHGETKSPCLPLGSHVLIGNGVDGRAHHPHHKGSAIPYRKLFVFGDSYADTGNLGKLGRDLTYAWYTPYGITFPHRPTGRFSDGLLLTDYFASFLGIKSPIPYKYRKMVSKQLLSGMNFAVGGTGVFDTGNLQRNLRTQIDVFEAQINEKVFSDSDLKSSLALVSVAGNDYTCYVYNGGTEEGLMKFMDELISQLKSDLKRMHDLGVRKVLVTYLTPLGCAPAVTRRSSYSGCDMMMNFQSVIHNDKLENAVKELGQDTNSSAFHTINLFDAFGNVFGAKGKFAEYYKPCCEGKTNKTNCGEMTAEGVKQFSLCSKPQNYFYWDSVHPSQGAWRAVFDQIRAPLHRILR